MGETPPPCARGGRVEGRIVVVEGERANDLTVGRLIRVKPLEVSSHVCCESLDNTGTLRPLGEFWLTVLQHFNEGQLPV